MTVEAVELFIGTYIHNVRYGVNISNQKDPRITQSDGYGIITNLPSSFRNYCSDLWLVELLYNSGYEIEKIFVAIRLSEEIDRDLLKRQMINPFFHFDWESRELVDLPKAKERL